MQPNPSNTWFQSTFLPAVASCQNGTCAGFLITSSM
jgi:hypothetical protein